MKRSPGPMPCSALTTKSTASASVELVLDPALHALGEHVARALDPGQVDQHQLPGAGGVRGDAPAGPAGGLRTVGDNRDLRADDRVHDRRLADVRTPASPTKPVRVPGGMPPRLAYFPGSQRLAEGTCVRRR